MTTGPAVASGRTGVPLRFSMLNVPPNRLVLAAVTSAAFLGAIGVVLTVVRFSTAPSRQKSDGTAIVTARVAEEPSSAPGGAPAEAPVLDAAQTPGTQPGTPVVASEELPTAKPAKTGAPAATKPRPLATPPRPAPTGWKERRH